MIAFARTDLLSVAAGILAAAGLCSAPPARAAGDGALSAAEFRRYQNAQALELQREQALHADLNARQSPEEAKRQRRRFESERVRQRQLLERQRRSLAAERARARSSGSPVSSRGLTRQRLRLEHSSERLRRKLLR